MNKTTEALKLAEEALEELHYSSGTVKAVTLYKSALAAIREALAEPVKQEPVAIVVSKYGDPESFGERRLEVLIDIQALPYDTPFYAAPVDAKAIRSEALEEAAKVCRTAQAQGFPLNAKTYAAAIRGLK